MGAKQMGQGLGLMTQREAQRLVVLQGVKDGKLSQEQAAQQLGLSTRQVKRLLRRLRDEGAAGLISKRRGMPSNRRIAQQERDHVISLVRQHYADFGPELAREYLASAHGFVRSTETLRSWMIAAGLWKPKLRRAKRVHPVRPRRDCSGRAGANRRQPPRLV
jgi:transposase